MNTATPYLKAMHADACDLAASAHPPSASRHDELNGTRHASNKYVIRLCSTVINSALTRFSRDVDNIQRGLSGDARVSPEDTFREARQEGNFIIRNIDTIVQQHGKESDLGDTLKKLHQYQLALKSIKLESPRCRDNLLALRATFIRSVTDIDQIINDLAATTDAPVTEKPAAEAAAPAAASVSIAVTSPSASPADLSEAPSLTYDSDGLLDA